MNKDEKTPFQIVTELNYVGLMIFVLLLSLADNRGKIQVSMLRVLKTLNGSGSNKERPIALTQSEFRERLKRMAYMGILQKQESAEPNHHAKTIMYSSIMRLEDQFVRFMPRTLLSSMDSEEIVKLKTQMKADGDHRGKLNKIITRLREEIRLSHQTFIPEFKLENKDGTINKRSVEFRKMWAWFVLLEVERAFEKIKYKNSDPDNPIKDLDYQTMAMWVSSYGIENIEGLFMKFYGSQRLMYIKEESGAKWPEAVKRFIFGALRKQNQNTKQEKDYESTKYKPRRQARDPLAEHGNQIEMPRPVSGNGKDAISH